MSKICSIALFILALSSFQAVTHSAPLALLGGTKIRSLASVNTVSIDERSPAVPYPMVEYDTKKLLSDGTIKCIEDPSVFKEDDKRVFEKRLEDVVLGDKIAAGSNNFGIWMLTHDYKGYHKSDLIVKILPVAGPKSYGEVKALRIMGLLVESGEIKVNEIRVPHFEMLPKDLEGKSFYPAIIMKKMPGKLLRETDLFKAAGPKEQLAVEEQVIDWSCKRAVKDAITHKVYHDDNNLANTLVTVSDGAIKAVDLVDYGSPGTYLVMKEVEEEKLYDMCSAKAHGKLKKSHLLRMFGHP
ncbi:hypothetical protein C8J55DRAFT_548687 [Lentinula edodes]|uniref:Protein kinase domain-containing protein n=1 Tax=Lentinula lateritia TaxID=40482 RepID=A0A9W9AJI6_9AGAR|nr:hypothetical protein C8J55DRAFT_548687 [Lentinula edodes]